MNVLRALDAPGIPRGSVIALGNFDGLHRGHMRILGTARDLAAQLERDTLVLTFDPHPVKVLRGDSALRLLQSTTQKLQALGRWGFDHALLFPFSREFSSLSPTQFVVDVLSGRLAASAVVIGAHFSFGRGRTGTAETLDVIGRETGLTIVSVPAVRHHGHVISSTWIRTSLSRADVIGAEELLGRPYSIEGPVVSGDHRGGSTLGVPTANVSFEQEVVPPPGVYLTLSLLEDAVYPSVTNIGYRPTFGGGRLTAEAHLLGFSGHLYGRRCELFFLRRIRDEMVFSSADALRHQIEQDRRQAELWLATERLDLSRCRPQLHEDLEPHAPGHSSR